MFTKATRKHKKLRLALAGPSGAGKTYTALMLATALAEQIPQQATQRGVAVIDTERGSASLYSTKFAFDVSELESFHPDNYIKAIREAEDAGYSVLVIDSLSHAWAGPGGVLEQVDKRGGNKFTDGWGKIGTPLQNRLIDAILNSSMHIIVTMRVKSGYVIEQNDDGKSVPRRIGLKEVQREGVEYEMDVLGQLDLSNTLTIEKSRMSELAGEVIALPDGKLAVRIYNWLNEGAPGTQSDHQRWTAFCKENGFTVVDIEAALGVKNVGSWMREREVTLDTAMDQMIVWATAKTDSKRTS